MANLSASRRLQLRKERWKVEIANNFSEAETQTRAYWRDASPTERLNGLEALRKPFYGPDQTSGRLQRFLELVPLP